LGDAEDVSVSNQWRSTLSRPLRLVAIAILVAACSAAPSANPQSPRRSGSAICLQAVAAAKIGHSGSAVTFTDPTTGAIEDLVLPVALQTRVVNDRGQLLAPDGTVIGSEGDVVTIGGGGSPWAVCAVNGVNYLGS
jgi:hypothetical protein